MTDVLAAVGRSARVVRRWSEYRLQVDTAFAGLISVLAVANVAAVDAMPGERSPDVLAYGLVLAGSAGLLLRRRWPIAVLGWVVAVMVAFWATGYTSLLSVLGLPPFYAVAVHGVRRRRVWAAITAAMAAVMVSASLTVLRTPRGFDWFNLASVAAYLAGAVVAGTVIRNRERIFTDTQLRADRAEAERLVEAERAVARERRRIAREMHDVVAHGMSVITVQAAAAQEIARTNPAKAIEVMARIEDAGRESLTEMRRMLGVLRDHDDAPPSLAPQPTLKDLSYLITHYTESGIGVELIVSGERRHLPAGIDLAGYRIVQEALTNVLKHAGTGASCTVRIHYDADALEIDATDNGHDAATRQPAPGGAKGLIGMHERVEIYGGELSAGPQPEGGFRVQASLPLNGRARGGHRAPGDPAPSGHQANRDMARGR